MRRIGVLMTRPPDDRKGKLAWRRSVQGLQAAGLDRWAQRPDRLALGRRRSSTLSQICGRIGRGSHRTSCWPSALTRFLAVQQATRTVPIVFRQVIDPVGAGFVASLARPGGNVTGFLTFEYSIARNGWSCSKRLRQA